MLEIIIPAAGGLAIGLAIGWLWRSQSAAAPQKITQLEEELRCARDSEVESRTKLAHQSERFDEEKTRLADLRQHMESTFKAMAADIVHANSKAFLEQANEKFNALRDGSEKELEGKKKLIDEKLASMDATLKTIHHQSTALKTSIDTSQKTTAKLSEDTARLREVLSSSQKRGQWGERMVVDILQVIGFVENVNYTQQQQVESGQRPDFTFILPQEKVLNMDVKFPLARYENYLAADSKEIRAQEKTAFLKAVEKHIVSVSGREYINPAEGTLNYVMLFIPNESIYGFINDKSTELVDFALSKRVLLCSPLTLYAMLSLIHQAARNFHLNERASEVMGLVAKFRHEWKKYSEQMDKLGRRIEGLSGDFHALNTTRARALEKPLDKIESISLATAQVGDDAQPALASATKTLPGDA